MMPSVANNWFKILLVDVAINLMLGWVFHSLRLLLVIQKSPPLLLILAQLYGNLYRKLGINWSGSMLCVIQDLLNPCESLKAHQIFVVCKYMFGSEVSSFS